jgi:predicted transport protein
MSETRLFQLNGLTVSEIASEAGGLEKSLQTLIERNLPTMLGVQFLASEYPTGKLHGGRIDTLGLDEDDCPVIVEYKRAISENVINQGLDYLDWLMDHKAEFKLLVLDRLDKDHGDSIDWTSPRLICIAAGFTKHDERAVRQMNRNIDLIRFRRFGTNLLALELLTSATGDALEAESITQKAAPAKKYTDKPVSVAIAEMSDQVRDLYEGLRAFILALGDDVTEKQLKLYVAYRRIKNFASVVVQKSGLNLYLKIDPATVDLVEGFTRDVRTIGHWGTGDLEVVIRSKDDLKRAEPLVLRSYEGT